MEGYKPGQIGYELDYISTSNADAETNLEGCFSCLLLPIQSAAEYEEEHLRKQEVIKRRVRAILSTRLDDNFLSDDEIKRDLSNIIHPDMNPEEQVEHEYNGDTPQDPQYWEKR